jgi:hypothetical protein
MRIKIVKWNPINDEYGDVRASVFIKPTLELLEFANRNVSNGNRTMMVRLSGTGNAIYDGAPFFAILDKTSDAPNCRQNFFNTTGLYVLTLSVRWFGYPENLGEVTFLEGILEDTFGNDANVGLNVDSVDNVVDGVDENVEDGVDRVEENVEDVVNKNAVKENYEMKGMNERSNNTNENNDEIRKISVIGIVVSLIFVILILVANVYDRSA